MKDQIKKHFFLIALLCIGLFVQSQSINDLEFDTGYKIYKNQNNQPLIGYVLEEYDDSTLSLSFYRGNPDSNRVVEKNHYLISHDLQIQDTISV